VKTVFPKAIRVLRQTARIRRDNYNGVRARGSARISFSGCTCVFLRNLEVQILLSAIYYQLMRAIAYDSQTVHESHRRVIRRARFTHNKALKYRRGSWLLRSATALLSGEYISGDDWPLCKRGNERTAVRKFEARRTFRTIST